MAESMGGDVGSQVLRAVQALSEQVRSLGDRMDRMEARMDMQREWLQRLANDGVETRNGVNQARRELRSEIQEVRTALMEQCQELPRKELRLDLQALRMELQLGLNHVHARIDRASDALLLRELYRVR